MNYPFGKGWTRPVCNNLQLKQEDINEFADEDGWIDNHDESPEDDDEESYDEIGERENRVIDRQERDFNF